MKATIETRNTALTTFVQTWTVRSRDAQRELLSVMKHSAGVLQRAHGFVSLSLHPSDDGGRVAVYGQWASAADLHAAVDSPEAKAWHDKFLNWGSPDGGALYRVEDVLGPTTDADVTGKDRAPDPTSRLYTEARARWATQGFTTRRVAVNGFAMHVAEKGEGDPVVLLHGYPQSGESWRQVAADLATNHRVVIPDLPGMGLSDPGKAHDLATVADDLHQLAAVLGLKTVKLAGHDWGGSVGAVYALRYREDVSKLAFIDSAIPGAGFETQWTFAKRNDVFTFIPFLLMGQGDPDGDVTVDLLEGREAAYLHHLWKGFTGDAQAAPFEAWAPYVEAISRPGMAASSAAYYRDAYQTSDQVKALLARKLEIPVLPISGSLGIGKKQEALVAPFAATPSPAVILEGSGHFVPEERPKELVALLQHFFAAP